MTHQEVLESTQEIKINSLYSLENISDCYVLVGYNIINKKTNYVKAISRMSRHKKHYPYLTLTEKGSNRQRKVLLHKILALAYINNGPYELIEHIDDNPENYNIENLMFSNQSMNLQHAFINGHSNRIENIFKVILKNGIQYTGTIKELTAQTGIPRQTLYSLYYKDKPGKWVQSIKLLTGQQTIEKVSGA